MDINIRKMFFISAMVLSAISINSNLLSMQAVPLNPQQQADKKKAIKQLPEGIWSTLSRKINRSGMKEPKNCLFSGDNAENHQEKLQGDLKSYFKNSLTEELGRDGQFFYSLNKKDVRDELARDWADGCINVLSSYRLVALRHFLEDRRDAITNDFEKNIAVQLESLAHRGSWGRAKTIFNPIKFILWYTPEFFMFMGIKDLLLEFDPAGATVFGLAATAFVVKKILNSIYGKIVGKSKNDKS